MPSKTLKKKFRANSDSPRTLAENSRQSRLASMEPRHLRSRSRAAKKIQSMTRGRRVRQSIKKKHDDFMETYNDRVDPNIMSKIFYQSVFDDDIMDRRESLEELEKERARNYENTKKLNKSIAFHPNYDKLQDTGLFKSETLGESIYYTREGDILSRGDFLNYSGYGKQILYPNSESLDSDSSNYAQKKHLKDWYQGKMKETFDQHTKNVDTDVLAIEKDKQLAELETLNIFKCKKMKNLLDADPQLYLDPNVKHFSDQCRNDMTKIFFNTFFELNWRLIMPKNSRSNDLENKINNYPTDKFTSDSKVALLDTLVMEGLFKYNQFTDDGIEISVPSDITQNRFDVLANYFKWSDGTGNNIRLRHLPDEPLMRSYMNGKFHLSSVLDRFEKTIIDRNIYDKNSEKIEQMKRYFILSLIGLDTPYRYKYMLDQQIFITNRQLATNKTDIKSLNVDIDYIKLLIDGDALARNTTDGTGPFISKIIEKYGSLEDALDAKPDELNTLNIKKSKLVNEIKQQNEVLDYISGLTPI